VASSGDCDLKAFLFSTRLGDRFYDDNTFDSTNTAVVWPREDGRADTVFRDADGKRLRYEHRWTVEGGKVASDAFIEGSPMELAATEAYLYWLAGSIVT